MHRLDLSAANVILICLDLTSFMLYDNLNIDFVVRQKKGHTTIGMAFSSAFFLISFMGICFFSPLIRSFVLSVIVSRMFIPAVSFLFLLFSYIYYFWLSSLNCSSFFKARPSSMICSAFLIPASIVSALPAI